MARRNYTFDANNQLSDGGAPITVAGWATVGGAQGIVDLGGNQGITITLPSIANTSTITPQQARIDAVAVLYITAATLGGSDVYKVMVVGSNNAGLNVAAGNYILGMLEFGIGTAMDAPNCANSAAAAAYGGPSGNQYEILFTNEVAGTPLEFISLYVTGTFGSVTLNAFVAVLPRE